MRREGHRIWQEVINRTVSTERLGGKSDCKVVREEWVDKWMKTYLQGV